MLHKKFLMNMNQMKNNKTDAIILLSGGLDCTVALSDCINKFNVVLALTFDYGQKSFEKEVKSAKNICAFYDISHKTIKLDWLKDITKTSLVSDKEIPKNINLEAINEMQESCKNVWIPNRNSVFINIAAAHLDALNGGVIIIGANKEEAQTFSDNSQKFIDNINKTLEFSCQQKIYAIAPLINANKVEILNLALKNNAPLDLIHSCYENGINHCGLCESCLRLKRALKENKCNDLINKLFG